MSRTGTPHTPVSRLAAAGALSAALAAASPALAAAPPAHANADHPFGPAYAPVDRAKLDDMRGGFVTPTGVEIKVGVAVTGRVTGPDVPDFEFTVGRRIDDTVEQIADARGINGDTINDDIGDGTLNVAGGASNGGVTVNAAADVQNAAQALKTLLQAGSGNSAPDLSDIGGEGIANVIQNNLNNIDIELTNQVDLDTNMNLGGDLASRISDAIQTIQANGF